MGAITYSRFTILEIICIRLNPNHFHLFIVTQGSVQQLLDKKDDTHNQKMICTMLGE